MKENALGRNIRHRFVMVATEWTAKKELKMSLNIIVLPYYKNEEPDWTSDEVFDQQ